MGKLVPFRVPNAKPRAPVGVPPDDPLERASWLHNLLCNELFDAITDGTLTATERRDLVFQFSNRITQAMPNHEIAAARDELRRDEDKIDGKKKLGGQVTGATGSEPRPLRAGGPRGRSGS
ncbi:hypothetical protein LCGC14_1116780 [marine sediment metagenome]|uniref:Uncharacterized protein n=2 Tax=root TaxID=1 RepID=A0A9C9TJI1_9HYPH|nr:hypothetical protein [Aurantimonas coralicida]